MAEVHKNALRCTERMTGNNGWEELVKDNTVRSNTASKLPVDRTTHWENGTHTFLANIE